LFIDLLDECFKREIPEHILFVCWLHTEWTFVFDIDRFRNAVVAKGVAAFGDPRFSHFAHANWAVKLLQYLIDWNLDRV
jgi:hypothetical protein